MDGRLEHDFSRSFWQSDLQEMTLFRGNYLSRLYKHMSNDTTCPQKPIQGSIQSQTQTNTIVVLYTRQPVIRNNNDESL